MPHSAETTDALSDGLRSDLNATKAFYEQKLKLAERQREEADKVGLLRMAVGVGRWGWRFKPQGGRSYRPAQPGPQCRAEAD